MKPTNLQYGDSITAIDQLTGRICGNAPCVIRKVRKEHIEAIDSRGNVRVFDLRSWDIEILENARG